MKIPLTLVPIVWTLLFIARAEGNPLPSTLDHQTEHQRWQTLHSLPVPRQEHSVVSLDRRIYVLGGILSNVSYSPSDPPIDPVVLFSTISPTASMQYFDLDSQYWYDAASLPIPLNHANVASVDGKIYVLGGLSGTNLSHWNAVAESFVYDPVSDRWSSIAPMPRGTARGACAIGIWGNEIWLAGGKFLAKCTRNHNTKSLFSRHDTTRTYR